MKHFISLAIIAATALSGFSQHKINPAGRIAIERYRNLQAGMQSANSSAPATPPMVKVLVRMANQAPAESLAAEGYEISTDLGDMAVVNLPITEVETLAASDDVQSISFGRKRRLLTKTTRSLTGVDDAHNGIETNNGYQPFTGSGVVLGIMDGGLDANHPNFKDRVERLWHFSTDYYYNTTVTDYDASTISKFTTDEKEETHATHVAGIMAGGYRSTATFMNGSSQLTGNNPYYGMAPDATLAMSVGDLYDENIIQGVENIISYAESVGRPVAINMSLGSNSGPHDGSDDMSQALERLGQRGLLCLSAGNEGETDIAIEKTFTSADNTVKTMPYYNDSYTDNIVAGLDIWASDGQTLTVTIGNVSSSGTVSNATTISAATSSSGRSLSGCVKSGQIKVYAGIDPNSGRYNVYVDFSSAKPKTGRFSIAVTGKAGQRVNLYLESYYSQLTNYYNAKYQSNPLSGYTAGSPDGSISGMACGKNVLSVGAYSATNKWNSLGGYSYSTDQTSIGSSTTFSSYGKDFFGNQLPHISAPGSMLMSSFSSYYIDGGYGDDYDESASDMVASAKSGSKTYYWGPMEGTSMSCPVMTGILGLWLQADPSLTFDKVISILESTSTKDSFTAAQPERFGFGKVNAAEGLRYILAAQAIGTVIDDNRSTLIEPADGGYLVTVAGDSSFSVAIHDLLGRCISQMQSSEPTLFVPTDQLSAGIYVIAVNGRQTNVSRKITK